MSTGHPTFPSPKSEGQDMEGVKKHVYFGGFSVDVKVAIDSAGQVTFLEDIDTREASAFMSESDAQGLFDAGILKKGEIWEKGKNSYELASDGYDGAIYISKDSLNDAIKSGKLKVEVTEEGDIEIF